MTTLSTSTRRAFLGALAGGIAGAAGALPADTRRPNIVFILADDLGWRDTSLYGSKFCETPNVERLARRGMMFTQAYAAAPICSPTRASILTGQYPARIGITRPSCHHPDVVLEKSLDLKPPPGNRAFEARSLTRLKLEYFTLAEALKEAGYKTGHFGKWHLGREPYDALHQGFDLDVPHWYGPSPPRYIAPWKIPDYEGKPGEHIEDRMASEAVNFLRANKDRPFFLNYWCFSVHSPHQAKPELIEKYRAKADPKSPQRNPVYGAMVQTMDEAVGRLIDTIDELGIQNNTIIVFFSDNGGVDYIEIEGSPVTSNLPLRGSKSTLYEGGTREPCVVVWPGVVKPGSNSKQVVSSIDFYPTLLEAAGVKPKAGLQLDGVSIVPALKGGRLKRDTLFCHRPHLGHDGYPGTWVRKGDWKLIRFYADNDDHTDRFELYDLEHDLAESKNLAGQMPSKVAELNTLIDRFLRDTEAVVPKPNPGFVPGSPRKGNTAP